MSLAAESLLSLTGIFPTSVSDREQVASISVPETLAKRAAKLLTAEPAEMAYREPGDLDKSFATLSAPLAQEQIEALQTSVGEEQWPEYFAALSRARDYLVQAWPKFQVNGPAGVEMLPLSYDDEEEIASLIAILDDPMSLLDELASRTLTVSQADAWRTVYPEMHAALSDALTGAIVEKRMRDGEWTLEGDLESVINILNGDPPEPAPPKPLSSQKPSPDFSANPDAVKTQADVSGSTRTRKE